MEVLRCRQCEFTAASRAEIRAHRRTVHMPPGKRPLSAYSLFAMAERRHLREQSRCPLTEPETRVLLRERWLNLDSDKKQEFRSHASQEYKAWYAAMKQLQTASNKEVADSPVEDGGGQNQVEDIVVENITAQEILVEGDINSLNHIQFRMTGQSRLYHCPSCSHTANRFSNMRRHVTAVHQRRRFSCTDCEYSASKADRLRRHQAMQQHNAVHAQQSSSSKARHKRQEGRHNKRPPNAFILFCQDQTERVRSEAQQQQTVGAADIGGALAQRWRTLGDREKTVFKERYAALLKEYRSAKALSGSTGTVKEQQPMRTPFLVYTKEQYCKVGAELPVGSGSKEIFRELGRRWRTLNKEERRPYAESCRAAKLAG